MSDTDVQYFTPDLCSVFVSLLHSAGEDVQNAAEKCVQSNGVEHAEPNGGEDARAAVCASPVNGSSTDAEC